MDVAINQTTKSEDKHMKIHKYVGLDVHKDATTIAIAEGDRTGEVRHYGEISSDLVSTERALRKIQGQEGLLHVVYEAGPTGFVLYRRLQHSESSATSWHLRGPHSQKAAGKRPTVATPCNWRGCTGLES